MWVWICAQIILWVQDYKCGYGRRFFWLWSTLDCEFNHGTAQESQPDSGIGCYKPNQLALGPVP